MHAGVVSTFLVFKIQKSLSAMFAHDMTKGFTEAWLSLIGFLKSLPLRVEVMRLSCSCVPVNLVEMLLKRPGPCDPGPVAEA